MVNDIGVKTPNKCILISLLEILLFFIDRVRMSFTRLFGVDECRSDSGQDWIVRLSVSGVRVEHRSGRNSLPAGPAHRSLGERTRRQESEAQREVAADDDNRKHPDGHNIVEGAKGRGGHCFPLSGARLLASSIAVAPILLREYF